MASSMWGICCKKLNGSSISPVCVSIRNGHHLRGKPPGIAKSLETKLAEANYKDEAIHYRVDIGLPPPQINKVNISRERMKFMKEHRKSASLEKLARERKLLINLDETHQNWLKTSGPLQIKKIADHYGVYEHLFGDNYFYPYVTMDIRYELEEGDLPVFFGNAIKPSLACKAPKVSYDSDENSFWTLTLVNPDGHFTDNSSEYIHWLIGNIPGSNLQNGETIIEYLQPFPPQGVGFHRMIFVLYKHDKKLDFSSFKKEGPCLTLVDRTFNTYDFYKNLQDDMTPAGLAFYQTDWDSSLKDFYHHKLNMKEPKFEYDFPPPYIKKQKWFPIGEPFNLYMDKYRDPKQINKEYLVRKLKNVHPFKASPPPLPYPNAQYFEEYVPSWLKLEIRKSRLKWGRINDIE